MKTTKTTIILLALVLLTTAQPVEAMDKPKISNTRTASCLVKVTTDPSVLPGGIIAIDYLMQSSGVAGKAAREVLDIPPDIASGLIEVEEIESIFPDLGGGTGGMGIPPDYQPWVSEYGTTTTSGSATRTTPIPSRTPTRPPTARTARPSTPTTTPTRRKPIRPTPRRTPIVTQPLPSTTEEIILFRLHVEFPESLNVLMSTMFGDKPVDKKTITEGPIKPAAEEFMMALIDNLRSALSGAFGEYRSKLNERLNHAREEAEFAERQLVQMQADLREISDSRDLSRTVILRDISSLRQKLQTNMMDMTSYKSTIETTTKRIAETKAQIKEKLSTDTVAHGLQKIIDIHEEQVRRLGNKGHTDPETAKARENLARARIELAKRREELSKSAGGNLLSTLNEVLADASMQENEAMGQIKNLHKQIDEAEALLSRADDYELLSLKADIAKQSLEETLLWRARLGRNVRSVQPPDVTVIGAE
jgi:hypothetical protein